jgi:hypothetical protein
MIGFFSLALLMAIYNKQGCVSFFFINGYLPMCILTSLVGDETFMLTYERLQQIFQEYPMEKSFTHRGAIHIKE